jgi:hypothetical protein
MSLGLKTFYHITGIVLLVRVWDTRPSYQICAYQFPKRSVTIIFVVEMLGKWKQYVSQKCYWYSHLKKCTISKYQNISNFKL